MSLFDLAFFKKLQEQLDAVTDDQLAAMPAPEVQAPRDAKVAGDLPKTLKKMLCLEYVAQDVLALAMESNLPYDNAIANLSEYIEFSDRVFSLALRDEFPTIATEDVVGITKNFVVFGCSDAAWNEQ